jgi:outer membrane lipoprotein-sorting protein
MNSQNLILLGIGLFISLVITVVAVEQYYLGQNNPMEPGGLIWRVQTSFERIKDLETVVYVRESGKDDRTISMRLWYINGPDPTLRVRYLSPDSVKDEVYTVDRSLLSHYLPQENVTVIKRWVGFPLSALGVASFDIKQLEDDWEKGRVTLQVSQNIPHFDTTLFPCGIGLEESFSPQQPREDLSQFCPRITDKIEGSEHDLEVGFSGITNHPLETTIPGGYILKVYDAKTGLLTRMLWIDRETYLIKQIVILVDGRRTTSIHAPHILIDQGLTPEELLVLPRTAETIRN